MYVNIAARPVRRPTRALRGMGCLGCPQRGMGCGKCSAQPTLGALARRRRLRGLGDDVPSYADNVDIPGTNGTAGELRAAGYTDAEIAIMVQAGGVSTAPGGTVFGPSNSVPDLSAGPNTPGITAAQIAALGTAMATLTKSLASSGQSVVRQGYTASGQPYVVTASGQTIYGAAPSGICTSLSTLLSGTIGGVSTGVFLAGGGLLIAVAMLKGKKR
jgi:hypothetical protein